MRNGLHRSEAAKKGPLQTVPPDEAVSAAAGPSSASRRSAPSSPTATERPQPPPPPFPPFPHLTGCGFPRPQANNGAAHWRAHARRLSGFPIGRGRWAGGAGGEWRGAVSASLGGGCCGRGRASRVVRLREVLGDSRTTGQRLRRAPPTQGRRVLVELAPFGKEQRAV